MQYSYEQLEEFVGLINTIAISEAPNGDEIRIDLSPISSEKPIFYFSHDGDEMSLVQLAPSFEEYVQRLLKIAVVGPEIWQQAPFISERAKGIDLSNPNTLDWIHLWRSTQL